MARRPSRLGSDFRLEDRLAPATVTAGTLDSTFGTGGLATVAFSGNSYARGAAVQRDGKIVLVGSAPGTNGTDFAITRLNTDGSLDTSFGTNGQVIYPFDLSGAKNDVANGVAIQPNGQIVVVGTVDRTTFSTAMGLLRLNTDGTPDSGFGSSGKVVYQLNGDEVGNAVAIQPDNQIVIAGGGGSNFIVARYAIDGTLDKSFGSNGSTEIFFGGTEYATSVVVRPDGRILMGGYSDTANFSTNDFAAAQVNSDGSLDLTFGYNNSTWDGTAVYEFSNTVGGTFENRSLGLALLSGGDAVLVGFADRSSSGNSDFAAVRINAGGTPVTSFGKQGFLVYGFNQGGGNNDSANAVVAQPNGQLIMIGTVERAGNAFDFGAVRINSNGSSDANFGSAGKVIVNSGSGNTVGAYAGAYQSDSRIVLAGGNATNFLAVRLTGDRDAAGGSTGGGSTDEIPPDFVTTPDVVGEGTTGPNGLPQRWDPFRSLPPVLTGGPNNGTARVLLPRGGGYEARSTYTFFPGQNVSVRTAIGDVNGDGVDDYIGGTGPGVSNRVVILDGVTGSEVANWQPFEASFTGGVYVAAADLNGDGVAEVVVTPDEGGGPVVAIFDGGGGEILRFYGIEDSAFRGGARLALGDFNRDGTPDLVVSAGFLGGPRIAIFSGKGLTDGAEPTRLTNDFFAFEDSLRNGSFVSAGDVDGDGVADIVFAAGPGGGPRARVFSGKKLLAAGPFGSLDNVPQAQIADFMAGDASKRGGARVVLRDVDADDRADLVVGSGEQTQSLVSVYSAKAMLGYLNLRTPYETTDPFGSRDLAGGVFVG